MNINKISFKLVCLLGSIKLPKTDLDNLQIGDILVLDSKINNPLYIFVNDHKFFSASLGYVNNCKAIKIEKNYER